MIKSIPTNFNESFTLDKETESLLREWCSRLVKRQTINCKFSSYKLKHIAEKELGFYVSNLDFKTIMHDLGFKYKVEGINEYYNLSSKQFTKGVVKRD